MKPGKASLRKCAWTESWRVRMTRIQVMTGKSFQVGSLVAKGSGKHLRSWKKTGMRCAERGRCRVSLERKVRLNLLGLVNHHVRLCLILKAVELERGGYQISFYEEMALDIGWSLDWRRARVHKGRWLEACFSILIQRGSGLVKDGSSNAEEWVDLRDVSEQWLTRLADGKL